MQVGAYRAVYEVTEGLEIAKTSYVGGIWDNKKDHEYYGKTRYMHIHEKPSILVISLHTAYWKSFAPKNTKYGLSLDRTLGLSEKSRYSPFLQKRTDISRIGRFDQLLQILFTRRLQVHLIVDRMTNISRIPLRSRTRENNRN